MKLYLSTPVTSRKEDTEAERIGAARTRCWQLAMIVASLPGLHDADSFSVFDIIDGTESESEIMGKCVKAVMESDAIFMDHGWMQSRGCRLERSAALLYGKKVFYLDWMACQSDTQEP